MTKKELYEATQECGDLPRQEALERFCGGYWDGECKHYPLEEWVEAAAEGSTRMGYWEWTLSCLDSDAEAGFE